MPTLEENTTQATRDLYDWLISDPHDYAEAYSLVRDRALMTAAGSLEEAMYNQFEGVPDTDLSQVSWPDLAELLQR